MHQDTKFDLRTCERGPEPIHRPIYDLTQNRTYADTAIGIADRFFKFDFSQVIFSGFAREDDEFDGEEGDSGPCYYVEVWNGGEHHCTVGFTHVGILGTLHVDLKQERDVERALGCDLIGALRKAVNKELDLPDTFPRAPIARVHGDTLYLNVNIRP